MSPCESFLSSRNVRKRSPIGSRPSVRSQTENRFRYLFPIRPTISEFGTSDRLKRDHQCHWRPWPCCPTQILFRFWASGATTPLGLVFCLGVGGRLPQHGRRCERLRIYHQRLWGWVSSMGGYGGELLVKITWLSIFLKNKLSRCRWRNHKLLATLPVSYRSTVHENVTINRATSIKVVNEESHSTVIHKGYRMRLGLRRRWWRSRTGSQSIVA